MIQSIWSKGTYRMNINRRSLLLMLNIGRSSLTCIRYSSLLRMGATRASTNVSTIKHSNTANKHSNDKDTIGYHDYNTKGDDIHKIDMLISKGSIHAAFRMSERFFRDIKTLQATDRNAYMYKIICRLALSNGLSKMTKEDRIFIQGKVEYRHYVVTITLILITC